MVTFNVNDFLPLMEYVARIVNNKNYMPILDSMLFEVKGSGDGRYIVITGCDSENWLSMIFRPSDNGAIDDDTPHSFCIDAKKLLQSLRGLSNGAMVDMYFEQTAKVVNFMYTNGHFTMPYIDADAFPTPIDRIDGGQKRAIPAQRLVRALQMTSFAVANDQLRPQMNGVHFDFHHDRLVVASTDARRLSKYTDTTIVPDDGDDVQVYGFTMPIKPVNVLMQLFAKSDEQLTVRFNETNATVMTNTCKLTTRLTVGKYPNFDAVIPKQSNVEAVVVKQDLLDALRRVMPLGSPQRELVGFHFGGNQVRVNAEDIDFSTSAEENVPCTYDADPISICFKGSNMIQLLSAIDTENVRIGMTDPTRAAVITPVVVGDGDGSEYVSMLMPMLIQ